MQHIIPDNYRIIPSFPDYCVEEFGEHVIKLNDDGSTNILYESPHGGVTLFKDGVRYCRSKYKLANDTWGRQPPRNTRGRQAVKVEALHVASGSNEWILFDSLTEASKVTGVSIVDISRVINLETRQTSHGWAFARKGD